MRYSEHLFEQLVGFEACIRQAIALFDRTFGVSNPCPRWRQGAIARTGVIGERNYEYSLHGRGCTVDIDGKTVSFDFDQDNNFVYSPFKFLSYLDDPSLSLSDMNSFFSDLNTAGRLRAIEGRGVRLGDVRKSADNSVD